METVFGAYLHCRPDGTPFYVGKGTEKRMRKLKRNNLYHSNIVSKHGSESILTGFLPCSDEATAFELEKGLIKRIKAIGIRLANMTEGGEGPSGYKHNKEDVARRAKEAFGRIISEEIKAKISKALTGVPKPARSVEHNYNMSKAKQGGKASQETRDKMSKTHLGKLTKVFKPWYIKYPDGLIKEVYDMSISAYARNVGEKQSRLVGRFSKRYIDRQIIKGIHTGYTFGYIN